MFPNVDTDDRHMGWIISTRSYVQESLTEKGILVSGGDHLQLFVSLVVPQPAPTRSLYSGSLGVDLFLQVVKRTEISVDLISKRSRGGDLGFCRSGRCEILPKELNGQSVSRPRQNEPAHRVVTG